jgi:D-lactate dehydrogenase (cytochrome)
MDQILDRLRQIVGPQGYLTDPADIAPHLVEGRKLFHGKTALVLRPGSTQEVAEIVKACAEAGLPIVPQGGNTGLVGGGVPSEDGHNVVLATARLNRIREVDAANFTMTVEAGCILAAIQEEALRHDRLFPLALAAEGSCQIGGNISTNAGGIQVLRYGNTRELVLGLEAVLPDGQIWNGLRGLRKDNTGYDLKQLFIGAEGTLGIVTAAKLKLFPAPHDSATAFVALPDVEAAMNLFARARSATGDQLTAFELMPRIGVEMMVRHMGGVDPLTEAYPFYALIELTSSNADAGLGATMEALLAKALEDELVPDGAIAASGAQAKAFWHLREGLSEVQGFEGGSIKHDVSVPVSAVAPFMREATAACLARLPGIRPVPFGHAGDGNIHFNLTQPVGADKQAYLERWGEFNELVHGIVARYGGSISAEHGIGLLKRDVLPHYKSALELELMARIKRAFDPQDLMNPGKLLALPDH